MFKDYLAKLNAIGEVPATHENFVAIQQIRSDILSSYTEGRLSDFEKRHLFGISSIIMDEMRDALNRKEKGNG